MTETIINQDYITRRYAEGDTVRVATRLQGFGGCWGELATIRHIGPRAMSVRVQDQLNCGERRIIIIHYHDITRIDRGSYPCSDPTRRA